MIINCLLKERGLVVNTIQSYIYRFRALSLLSEYTLIPSLGIQAFYDLAHHSSFHLQC